MTQNKSMKLIRTEHEVSRASFQMRDHDISILFLHMNDGGRIEYRAENFRGSVVLAELNPKKTFHAWVLSVIKTVLAEHKVKA